jgi:general secretion pathway protein B
MSYILDALKKADQQRTLGEVPDLETAHWGARKSARSYIWIWIIAALLAFNGLLLTLLPGRDGPAETVVESDTPGVPPAAIKSRIAPVLREKSPAEPPVTTRPRVKVQPAVIVPPAMQAKPAPAPEQANVPATAKEYEIPEWRELSLEFRSGFRLPRIDVHVYDEDPGRRFIMADLKKYREGQTLANGALLEKIHAGSIQLYHQGKRFRVDR